MISFSLLTLLALPCFLTEINGWIRTNPRLTMSFETSKLPNTQSGSIIAKNLNSMAAVTTGLLFAVTSNIVNAADNQPAAKKTKKPKVLETDLGIKYIELIKGSGPYPNTGDFVIISYTGFLSNGTVFDSTEVKGRKPLSFRFGQKQIIEGLESVISNMQPGGQCTCNIPAKYAYGAKGVCLQTDKTKGSECLIPPNEDLKYAVKLISLGAGYN